MKSHPAPFFVYAKGRNKNPPDGAQFPCAVLSYDNWNDFGWYTLRELRVFEQAGDAVFMSTVKVLQSDSYTTELPERFTALDKAKYCSLGQSLNFYRDVASLEGVGKAVLKALNDVVLDQELGDYWEQREGFKTSLLRFAEAQKAFNIAGTYVGTPARAQGLDIDRTIFSTKMDGAAGPHEVDLDFSPDGTGLHRMMAIIGRNGTGKTQVLARIATAVARGDRGSFDPKRPWFSKVIAVSYSIFDDFERPKDDESQSYAYCGVRTPDPSGQVEEDEKPQSADQQLLSPSEMRSKLLSALKQVSRLRRNKILTSALRDLLGDQVDFTIVSHGELINSEFFSLLSSGQRMLTLVFAELVASIEVQALVLYDEPELYLHPDALSALARAFHRILEEFDSFAVLATHSPLLLQEIPAKRVRVFSREGTMPIVDPLQVESFGENLTTITDTIFQSTADQQNYRSYLARLASEMSVEEVLSAFRVGPGLGMNARMALVALAHSQQSRL